MTNKITALIPTYQRPEFLRRAISSILTQTYRNVQVSIFNNASGDNTAAVVKQLMANDSRIQYHCHANNIGSLRNFKYAFASVDTPYFSVLGDDDCLAPSFYEDAIKILDNYPELGFVILDTLSINKEMQLIGHRGSSHTLTLYCGDSRFDIWHTGVVPNCWTAMVFRKEVAQIYNEMQDKYDVAADMRFLLIAAAQFNFAYLSKVGAFFTTHPNTTSSSRPHFDIVHHIVQISRYVEVYHDTKIGQPIKDKAVFYLRKRLLSHRYKPWTALREALPRAIKNICESKGLQEVLGARDVLDAGYAGYKGTAWVLQFLYYQPAIRKLIFLLFFQYYKKRKNRHQAEMMKLQNGIYKDLFEHVRTITPV